MSGSDIAPDANITEREGGDMKISVDSGHGILLEEVYNGVGFKTKDGEHMGICMRDSGFEFKYEGSWYSAQKGVIKKMEMPQKSSPGFVEETPDGGPG